MRVGTDTDADTDDSDDHTDTDAMYRGSGSCILYGRWKMRWTHLLPRRHVVLSSLIDLPSSTRRTFSALSSHLHLPDHLGAISMHVKAQKSLRCIASRRSRLFSFSLIVVVPST